MKSFFTKAITLVSFMGLAKAWMITFLLLGVQIAVHAQPWRFSEYYISKEELLEKELQTINGQTTDKEWRIWIRCGICTGEDLIVFRKLHGGKFSAVVYQNRYFKRKKTSLFNKRAYETGLDTVFKKLLQNGIYDLPETVEFAKPVEEDMKGFGDGYYRINVFDGYRYKIETLSAGVTKTNSYGNPKAYMEFYDPSGSTRRLVNILEALVEAFNINHEIQ